jgi:amino acid transporter
MVHLADEQRRKDEEHLSRFGYQQELQRVLHLFANFAVGFTYLSPLVGVYALFAFGLSTAGPAFIWGIPIVVIGQLFVVLIFAELAATYPLAGALYQWARYLLGPFYGVYVGYIYAVALIITIAAIDYGGAPFLLRLLRVTESPGALLLAALGILLLQTAVNIWGVRRLALVLNLGVLAEVVGTAVLGLWLLLFERRQPLEVLFSTAGTGSGIVYFGAFVTALLFAAWIFYGFESAADVAEEVLNPVRTVPKAMLLTLLVGGVASFLATMGFILATPDVEAAMASANPIDDVLAAAFPGLVHDIFLLLIVYAFISCGGAVQVAASRVLYAFARDRLIPPILGRVNPQTHTPIYAILATAVISGLLMLRAQAITVLTSFAVVGIYLAFQLVVFAALVARLRGWRPHDGFTLGKFALPVNLAALVYGISMIVNLVRPTGEGFSGWQVLIVTIAVVVVGLLLVFLYRGSIRRFAAPRAQR